MDIQVKKSKPPMILEMYVLFMINQKVTLTAIRVT